MEQLNKDLPEQVIQEEKKPAVEDFLRKEEAPLLIKIRQKFGVFGGISLVFGLLFTMLFYEVSIGLNVFAFTIVMVGLLCLATDKLSVPRKRTTLLYYAGAILLGLSTMLTSSGNLQFINVIGILLLLDLSLLHQFYEDGKWDFTRHFMKMIGLLFLSIASLGKPFVHGAEFMKQVKVLKNDRVRNIFIGVVISVPLLLVILALLSSADILFGEMTKSLFQVIFSGDVFGICFMLAFGILACYCILCGAVARVGKEDSVPGRKVDASIAVTVMLILCFVYVVFCGIQLTYLFANGIFVLPEEFTFAEYARRGFFELLAVASINIILMLAEKALFRESRLVSVLVTIMSLCTYIMIGSATYRMLLYIGAYHLTFLRVFVLLSLFIIAFVLAGVVITEFKKEFPLFQYCVVVVTASYLVFSFSKPDHYIAEYLLDHVDTLSYSDMGYLTRELSLDAAPAVLPVLSDKERWVDEKIDDGEPEGHTGEYNREYAGDYDREYTGNYDGEYGYMDYGYKESAKAMKEDYYARIRRAASGREFRDFNYSIFRSGQSVTMK
ncbi:MAG TPA: DUF4173 domain-containing protein [Clostridiales bacterium]|nr:DUF4173 domain-containing protein [Clostridiales bacterium]